MQTAHGKSGLQTWANRASDLLEAAVFIVCFIQCLLMLFVVLIAVFYRYVLGHPPRWTEELARFIMIWMGLLGISLGFRRNSHIGVSFFIDLLPPKLRRAIILVTRLLTLFFLGIVIREGIKISVLVGAHQISPGLQISMLWPMLALPVSGCVMFLQLVLVILIEGAQGKSVSGEPKFLQQFRND